MIEIPDDVEQWTYGKIVDLVHEGYDENDVLEIKKEINTDSERFTQSVCAFANTDGGTIIFGIDNNRQKSLHLNDRICGLDDTDQLKRNIIDKIKNIEPSIPIKNLIFRKSNIKLPNGKVIVILKVQSSNNKPHQYNHLFYKRLSDGNDPMNVSEVKQLILKSQQHSHNVSLLRLEFELLKDALERFKKGLTSNNVSSFEFMKYFDLTSTIHFQHNLAYLYPIDVPTSLSRFIHDVKRLASIPNSYQDAITGKKILEDVMGDAKKEGFDDPKEFVKKLILTRINRALDDMNTLSKLLDIKLESITRLRPEKS